tara:strand:+ start:173 stop:481 length:309 start_codon:yes stop_codon:yes gene_type:complete
MTYAISYQTAMFLIMLSVCLSSIVAGILVGVWHQKRCSDEETRLLLTIWEQIAELRNEVDFLMSFHEDTQGSLRDMPVVASTQEIPLVDDDITQPIPTRNIL